MSEKRKRLHCSIPKEVRRDLNIEVGDTVIVAIIGVEKSKKKKR
ncbi:MAG TPA: AbrB/MazE/SpoVT family DNA-binding domain-containing protein [Thermococcus paralvinellae]|uniref:AbrB/MazE/SpoVT family DNA-binding domain-containing protein n=1 Tax=Thermococcus paralvinellae TaxID=582419 RepID=A0A832ZA14_9EURY|nr:AbrB/MazE/SpoVT family DNA-binding domain-containing protein [Thermococcus paralvinellae]